MAYEKHQVDHENDILYPSCKSKGSELVDKAKESHAVKKVKKAEQKQTEMAVMLHLRNRMLVLIKLSKPRKKVTRFSTT